MVEEENWFNIDDAVNAEEIRTTPKSQTGEELTVFDELPAPKYSLGFDTVDSEHKNLEPQTVKPKYGNRRGKTYSQKPVRDFTETPATEEEMKTFTKQAENFIVWHLAQRNLTVYEAEQKMRKKQKWPDEAITAVIKKCVNSNWLNDEQYVENFIRSEQKWNQTGKYAIKMKLIKKGAPQHLIEEALNEVENETETENAKQLLLKTVKKMESLTDEKKTQRLLGLMSRKGYPASVAYPLVREIVNNPDIMLDEWE